MQKPSVSKPWSFVKRMSKLCAGAREERARCVCLCDQMGMEYWSKSEKLKKAPDKQLEAQIAEGISDAFRDLAVKMEMDDEDIILSPH